MSAAAEITRQPLDEGALSWLAAPLESVDAEQPTGFARTARSLEEAGVEAARMAATVGIVLAAEAAAGVGLWAAFGCFSALRAVRAVAGAARGIGEH